MALRGFIGFLLVVSIAFTLSSYMLFNLTIHDTGQKFIGKMISDRISEEISQEKIGEIERQARFDCKEKGVAYVEATKEPLKLDCSKIDKIPFSELLSNAMYDNIYYKKYDCSVIDCFIRMEKIPALIAQQNHSRYWIYYLYLLAIDIALAVLLFFICEGWIKRASVFGYVLLVSGLGAMPFFVSQRIFGGGMVFMNNILYAELVMLIIGIVLLVLAMIFKENKKEKDEEVEER